MRGFSIFLIVLGLLAAASLDVLAESPSAPVSGRVKPSAIATLDGGRRLFVASRENGSVAVVDVAAKRVLSVAPAGRGVVTSSGLPAGRACQTLTISGQSSG